MLNNSSNLSLNFSLFLSWDRKPGTYPVFRDCLLLDSGLDLLGARPNMPEPCSHYTSLARTTVKNAIFWMQVESLCLELKHIVSLEGLPWTLPLPYWILTPILLFLNDFELLSANLLFLVIGGHLSFLHLSENSHAWGDPKSNTTSIFYEGLPTHILP